MRIALALFVFAGCRDAVSGVPWLFGLSETVASSTTSDAVGERLARWSDRPDLDPGCPIGSRPGIELHADLTSDPGTETILVSLAHGIAVFDWEGKLITELPGYACEGSADELEAVAVGTAYGARTLVIAATSGGHRESATWVTLLRVDTDRSLDSVFTGTVEQRDGGEGKRGAVLLLPDALVYRHPSARRPTLWTYDPTARAYLERGQQVEPSYDGPMASWDGTDYVASGSDAAGAACAGDAPSGVCSNASSRRYSD